MNFTRGNTFYLAGPASAKVNGVSTTDMSGWTARSQIRDSVGDLIADLDVAFLTESPAVVALSFAGETWDWPVDKARIDVMFTTPGGYVVSTSIQSFQILQGVTREP